MTISVAVTPAELALMGADMDAGRHYTGEQCWCGAEQCPRGEVPPPWAAREGAV